MKCKKCGHENKRGAKFCDDCGVSLLGGVCPECGHKNRTDAQFCEKCGANIAGGLQKGAIPVEPKEKPGLSPVMRIIIGIIGIITFLGGGYRMLKALDFQLPEFFSKASSSDEAPSTEDSDVVRVAYTTNPATNVDEGKPIEMVFNWGAETE